MTYSSALIIAILAVTGVVPANQPVVATANTTIVRITLAQVRTIALKVHSGIIVAEELEAEKGGSGLRHSFDIKESKGTQESEASQQHVFN